MRFIIEERNSDWSGCEYNVLIDSSTGEVIDNDDYNDCPEDATFRRGLSGLVDLLNELAKESE